MAQGERWPGSGPAGLDGCGRSGTRRGVTPGLWRAIRRAGRATPCLLVLLAWPLAARALSITFLAPDFGGGYNATTIVDNGGGDTNSIVGEIGFDFVNGVLPAAAGWFSQFDGLLANNIALGSGLPQLYTSTTKVLTLTSFTATAASPAAVAFPPRLIVADSMPTLYLGNSTCVASSGSVTNGSGTLSGSTYSFLHWIDQGSVVSIADTYGFPFVGTATGPSPLTFTIPPQCGLGSLPAVYGNELVGLLELASGVDDSLNLPSSLQVAAGTLVPEPSAALLLALGLAGLALGGRWS